MLFRNTSQTGFLLRADRINLKLRKQGRAAAAATWRPKGKQDGHIPMGSLPTDSDSRRVQARRGLRTLEPAGYAEAGATIHWSCHWLSNGCPETEGLEVSSQQPSILSVTNHPETKRQSPDHRTFVIVGAKVTNKSLFWSHMALFWGNLFLGSLWLHFMEYGV